MTDDLTARLARLEHAQAAREADKAEAVADRLDRIEQRLIEQAAADRTGDAAVRELVRRLFADAGAERVHYAGTLTNEGRYADDETKRAAADFARKLFPKEDKS